MGAAGDGRAPTEERTCVKGWGFCSTDGVRALYAAAPDTCCLLPTLLQKLRDQAGPTCLMACPHA